MFPRQIDYHHDGKEWQNPFIPLCIEFIWCNSIILYFVIIATTQPKCAYHHKEENEIGEERDNCSSNEIYRWLDL